MSSKFINSLPIIAIMTPFILAFVLGLFKEKYNIPPLAYRKFYKVLP